MKIYGIGTDIANINRIKKSIKKKILLIDYLIIVKLRNVTVKLIKLIVMLKDLQLKKHFLKHLGLEFPEE